MLDFIGDYRNPIVGICVLLFIIAFVAVFDSIKNKQRNRKRQELLSNLSKSFNSIDLNQGVQDFIKYSNNSTQTLILIAQTYAKAGDHEQAISIYKTLNECVKNADEKANILEFLGESYYKAGFIERSKVIFSEILHNYPHNIRVLEYYIRTCENLKQYDEALSALECLEELYNNFSVNNKNAQKIINMKNYFNVMQICNDHSISLIQQQEQLLSIYNRDASMHNVILRHFRLYNIGLFWQKILESNNVMQYLDMLWHFKKHEIPFDFISTHEDILEIYRAKGYINEYKNSSNFTLEVLQLLENYSSGIKGDIEFIYYCDLCGGNSPFYTYRCSICAELGTIKLNTKPVKFIAMQ